MTQLKEAPGQVMPLQASWPCHPQFCPTIFFLLWLPAGPRASSVSRVPTGQGRSPTPIPGAPRPRPRKAARPVTHLLARLGRRMIAGCGAGCSCHGVGQILGRSIRLGVIHHLRTTHGSGASGGPGVAAVLRAGARGATATAAAVAVRVAAPAATAVKAGPRRPRAPRLEQAREGLAISGGPCAGTFIFSPSGCPLCLRLYSDGTTLPPAPRQEHDSVGLSLWRRHQWQQRVPQRQPQPQQQPSHRSSCPRSKAMLCIHTKHARGSSYHQRGRLGEDREAGEGEPECGEAGSFPPQLSGAVYLQSSTNYSPQRASRPAGGP